jgi:hypothetical protein
MNARTGSPPLGTALLLLVLSTLTTSSTSSAATGPLSLGAAAGTTGVGIEGEIGVGNRLCLRFSHSILSTARSLTYHGLPYIFDASMSWTSMLMDVHPADNGFRFTAGAMVNTGGVDLEIASSSPLSLGGRTYQPQELGIVRGAIEMNPLAPYVGLGFENRPESGRGLVFSTDIGVVAQTYRVSLSHEGGTLPLGLEQELLQSISDEEGDLEDELNSFGIFPVVKLSLTLRI